MTLPAPAAVLFDLDGTLLDTAPDFHAVLTGLCEERGVAPPRFEALHEVVSEGARAMVRLAFGLTPAHPDFDTLHQDFLERYAQHLCIDSQLYADFAQILDTLAYEQCPWGIVTNKPRRFAAPLLERLALHPDVLVCPDDVAQPKPAPDAILAACQYLHTDPGSVWYVGDHPRDIQAGLSAGCTTVVAAWGYIPANENPAHWPASACCSTPRTFHALLNSALNQD